MKKIFHETHVIETIKDKHTNLKTTVFSLYITHMLELPAAVEGLLGMALEINCFVLM
jgi:hypothetical protein